MEEKTVEQIAVELYPNRVDAALFLNGVSYAQQSQPMWREINDKLYYDMVHMRNKTSCILRSGAGWELLRDGYTHYLSSEDLLRLPVEKK